MFPNFGRPNGNAILDRVLNNDTRQVVFDKWLFADGSFE